MHLGAVDVGGYTVKGWAVDTQDNHRCAIDVYIDNEKRLTFLSGNDERTDVEHNLAEQQGVIATDVGFLLDISGLITRDSCQVALRFNKTGEYLSGYNPFRAHAPKTRVVIFDGVDGYQFFRGDKNSVIDQMIGQLPNNVADTESWSMRYCLMAQAARAQRAQFLAVVVPDKIAVVPGLLSIDTKLSDERLSRCVVDLSSRRFGTDVFYPLEDLLQAEEATSLVTRTDSHLSYAAHHRIYRFVMDRLGRTELCCDVRWVDRSFVHDLSRIGQVDFEEVEPMPVFDAAFSIFELATKGTQTRIYLNTRGVIPIVVLCGQSSCDMFRLYMQMSARITIMFVGDTFDIGILEHIKPDVVLHYISERNLLNSPSHLFTKASTIDRRLIGRAFETLKRMEAAGVPPPAPNEPDVSRDVRPD